MMSQLDFAQAKAQKSAKKIQVIDAPSPAYQVFIMRVDRPPFNDVKVRQAFRLIVDRQALINVALGGFGTPGNDLFGRGLPYFAKSLPVRKQDIEQAKSLLKSAGKTNLSVTLQTSDIVPGFTAAATLLAQQAQQAGVKVQIKTEPANAYFDTSLLYTKMTFAQSYWTTGSLAAFYSQALDSKAVWNETHFKHASFDALMRKATGATTVDAGHGTLAQGAEDPVRARWLHRLGQPEHRRRRLEQDQGHGAERVLQPRRVGLPRRLVRGLGLAWGAWRRPARLRRRVPPGGIIRSRAFSCAAWLRRSGRCSSSRCSSSPLLRCCRATPPAQSSERPRHRRRWRNCGRRWASTGPSSCSTPTG